MVGPEKGASMNGQQYAEALALCAGRCTLPTGAAGGSGLTCHDLLMALAKAEVPDLARRLVRWRYLDDPGERDATWGALQERFPLPETLLGAAIWEWLSPAICLTCCGGQAHRIMPEPETRPDSPIMQALRAILPLVGAPEADVRRMRWDQIKGRMWQPGTRTITLSRRVMGLITPLHSESPWVFPASDPQKPISQHALDRVLGREPAPEADFGPCPACHGTGVPARRYGPPAGFSRDDWPTWEHDYQHTIDDLRDLTGLACIRAAALLTENVGLDEPGQSG